MIDTTTTPCWIKSTPIILLCDFKSLWQQDDLMDAANLLLDPGSIFWIPDFWIWGRWHATCCWSYLVFLHHNKKKIYTLTMYSCEKIVDPNISEELES